MYLARYHCWDLWLYQGRKQEYDEYRKENKIFPYRIMLASKQ
jgi:hypothetical protein